MNIDGSILQYRLEKESGDLYIEDFFKEQWNNNPRVRTIIGALLGSATAEFTLMPITTIRTLYTIEDGKVRRTLPVITKEIFKNGGINGFFVGSTSALVSQMISTTMKYNLYLWIKEQRGTDDSDLINNSINGASGAVFTSLFTHPFDLWRVIQQKGIERKEKIPFISIVKEKIFTLYRGYLQTIQKNSLLYSILYPLRDLYRSIIIKETGWGYEERYQLSIASSLMTNLTTTTLLQPIDYIKVRRMAGLSWFDGYNPLNYYRGYIPSLCRIVPHFMITMLIIDHFNEQ